MSVVVKGHGRVEGRESLKAFVRVSVKYPSQVVEHSTKVQPAECTPTSFDVGFRVVVTRDELEARCP
jgi:hypothetical protein